jgi:hypothetical protein
MEERYQIDLNFDYRVRVTVFSTNFFDAIKAFEGAFGHQD